MNNENRVVKFEVCTRRKDGTDLHTEVLTLDDLLNRNGCYYNPAIQEIVYKRQFIGLTDYSQPENKDIFDGDILSWKSQDGVIFHNQVYWLVYRWRIKGNYKGKIFHSDLTSNQIFNHECKKIGNIYENPELLTK